MDCGKVRELNLDGRRRTLPPEQADEVRGHLSTCAPCRAHAEAERALSEVLEAKLPRYAAPIELRRRLATGWPASAPMSSVPRRVWRRARTVAMAAALSTAMAVLAGGATAIFVEGRSGRRRVESEAVNDHLRVLGGAPLAQVTGGLHEVKPWFGGKLDFAPIVRFSGNAEFPLQGGAVEPFLDRRAAVFVYKRRLHTASLFVVVADGLAFPTQLSAQVVRGFSVALWQERDQGYALISDLNLPELLDLQRQIASP